MTHTRITQCRDTPGDKLQKLYTILVQYVHVSALNEVISNMLSQMHFRETLTNIKPIFKLIMWWIFKTSCCRHTTAPFWNACITTWAYSFCILSPQSSVYHLCKGTQNKSSTEALCMPVLDGYLCAVIGKGLHGPSFFSDWMHQEFYFTADTVKYLTLQKHHLHH